MPSSSLFARWAVLLLAVSLASSAPAATPNPAPYSFTEAQSRAESGSASLAGAQAGLEGSRSRAAALGAGHLPVVSLSAQYLRYQKTVEVALGALREQALTSVNGYLAGLPIPLPPLPDNVLNGVVPDSVRGRVTENIWRPTLTVAWPLFTGGLTEAGQAAAQAGVRQSEAEQRAAQDALTLELVLTYFGQQLTAQTLQTSQENFERFALHLSNAKKLEAQGVLSAAQRLQVEVARNAAERQLLRSANDHETAQVLLSRTLREAAPVQPTSALFVASAPLPPQEGYVSDARARSPTLARLRALRDVTESGVQAAGAALLPQVFGFGSYNFNARRALLPDPDWIVGIGVHYTISSNVDRRQNQDAARAQVRQAEAALEQAGRDLETLVARSWHGVETARRQFLLLETNLLAAQENVRVQSVGFREGEAAATAVIDAQVALSVAQTQRAAAAFEYDVALAQLLSASGRLNEYPDHVLRADHRLAVVPPIAAPTP